VPKKSKIWCRFKRDRSKFGLSRLALRGPIFPLHKGIFILPVLLPLAIIRLFSRQRATSPDLWGQLITGMLLLLIL
jgi:hypothetical protein